VVAEPRDLSVVAFADAAALAAAQGVVAMILPDEVNTEAVHSAAAEADIPVVAEVDLDS